MDEQQLDPESQRLTIGVVTVCLFFSIASFVLRFYSRLSSPARCWWDDYWMSVVMTLSASMCIVEYLGLYYEAALQLDDPADPTVISSRQNVFASMLLWASGVFSVKVGILLFYWRVFPSYRFRVALATVGLTCLSIYLSNLGALVFQCSPVDKFWLADREGVCFDQTAFYLASAIINVISDVVILVLPLPVVWSLHASRGQKISLSLLFTLGSFVCIASIFRAIAVGQIDTQNYAYTNLAGGLWSTVEVNLGFICANLPFIRPLIARWLGQPECTDLHTEVAKTTRATIGAAPSHLSCLIPRNGAAGATADTPDIEEHPLPPLPRQSIMSRYSRGRRGYSGVLGSSALRNGSHSQELLRGVTGLEGNLNSGLNAGERRVVIVHNSNSNSNNNNNTNTAHPALGGGVGGRLNGRTETRLGIGRNGGGGGGGNGGRYDQLVPPPPRAWLSRLGGYSHLSSEFSLSSRASVRSSVGGINVRRVVVLRVEGVNQTHHRAKSFETHVTIGTRRQSGMGEGGGDDDNV